MTGHFLPPRGYGVRDRGDDDVVGAPEGRSLRVRPAIGIAEVVLGAPYVLMATLGLAQGRVDPALLLFAALGVSVFASGVRDLGVVWIRLGESRLLVRSRWFGSPQEIHAADIAWRADARFVGRRLVIRTPPGRLGIWRLSRADQRVLFAWLDAHAGQAGHGDRVPADASPPTPPPAGAEGDRLPAPSRSR